MARKHKCKWHGCESMVESWRWGCGIHFGLLPIGIRTRLKNCKPHWPEYKTVSKEAIDYSKSEQGIVSNRRPTECKCGAPALRRLPIAECLDCHKKRVFGQIEKVTGD